MEWIYLSPHFDDIAYSCGGLAWEQVQAGQQVSIWTICAGDPPDADLSPLTQELHARWKTGSEAGAVRREEDRRSCEILGVKMRHFQIPDVIYRTDPDTGEPVIKLNGDLFSTSPEKYLVNQLASMFMHEVPRGSQLVSPMTLGSHIDHLLVRAAAERTGFPLLYYADYPYVLTSPRILAEFEQGQWKRQPAIISEAGVQAWQGSIAAHASQSSTFWRDDKERHVALNNYCAGGGGRLWAK
jgi:LmbE family N-acetylglucosaminyl deacetylase